MVNFWEYFQEEVFDQNVQADDGLSRAFVRHLSQKGGINLEKKNRHLPFLVEKETTCLWKCTN